MEEKLDHTARVWPAIDIVTQKNHDRLPSFRKARFRVSGNLLYERPEQVASPMNIADGIDE